ncbi:hypothetical protein E5161_03215 [Cohnella pontilimi]|uniref:ABC transporter permease n=1 Tax=Cohnella pontilimi TaxID=2564100 RepID=A0A4U0FIV7_9BACL|nr:ABC transporter permease subunit [Cohnella pontilimi]TJY44404.1 hypothetical protein E5161_03215 [Cohnella pontilimi]
MNKLLGFEWRQNKRGFWIAFAVVVLLQAMFAGSAQSYIGNPSIGDMMKSMPQGMLEGFGIHPESLSTYEGWISGEPFTFFVLLLGFFAMNWAIGSIVKERDRQTAEFLFTLPRSRSEIYWSKWGAHLIQVLLVAVVSTATVLVLGASSGLMEHSGAVMAVTTSGFLTTLGFMGIGYALTPWLNSERGALSIGIGLVLLMFLFNMLASFGDNLSWLADLSLFHLFDPFALSQGSGMPAAPIATALALYAAGSLAGWVALLRRDL